ncbi:hypothetical protein ACH4UM_40640 [Streptomyces sp. NPDC020801]|uniref:allene oxide cyclase barrel-like domain-containing protein n=1 Tax=unclassified Streptomyces TaxID=2593676 RepID=UPI0037946858
MRHTRPLGWSMASGLATVLFCSPLASAATPTGPGAEEVFNLTAKPTQVQNVDVPPPGAGQGDQLIVTGDLVRSAVTVGRFDEVCTTVRTGSNNSSDLQCQITLSLPQGQITVQGVFGISASGPGDITLAITGGTGSYRAARGFIHAVSTSGVETEVTVHITR